MDRSLGWGFVAILGIDFGTAHTRAMLASRLAEDGTHEVVVPSMVLALPDGLRVGDDALQGAAQHPEAIVYGLKRLLGRTPGDAVAERVGARMGAKLSMSGGQLTVVTAGGQAVGVEDATAALMRHVAERLDPEPAEPRQVVVAIPEWYEPPQETSLGVAARKAGLEVLRYIEDAAAMALALAFDEPGQHTVAIVNLGAGALGVAFATIEARSVFLLASLSDRHIGGDDVIERLLDRALGSAACEPVERVVFRRAIEDMIAELAAGGVPSRTIAADGGREHLLRLDDDLLDDAVAQLREPLNELYEEALDEAALDSDEIDMVYATGVLSALSPVSDLLVELSRQVPRCEPSLERMVAYGATMQAAILSGTMDGPLVFDGKSTGSLHLSDFETGS
jgi:molecular chaperone HscA